LVLGGTRDLLVQGEREVSEVGEEKMGRTGEMGRMVLQDRLDQLDHQGHLDLRELLVHQGEQREG
jgi:hypothetical protein